MVKLKSIQQTQKQIGTKIYLQKRDENKIDERSFENTLKEINVIIEQLLKFQERMQKKDTSELRTIAEGIFF